MGDFDPAKLSFIGCELVSQMVSSPLLTFINPTERSADFECQRAISLVPEESSVIVFWMLSLKALGEREDAGEVVASCEATYRSMFTYEEFEELWVVDEESGEPIDGHFNFNASATLHSLSYSTVRGMFLLHQAQTPFAQAMLPIYTINELLGMELVEVEE